MTKVIGVKFKENGKSYYFNPKDFDIKENAQIISTGGGVILNPENVESLKSNSRIYFLDRPLELITATTDRPLSQTKQALEQRYNERYEIYCDSCDERIISNGTVQDTVNEIKGDFLK